MTQLLRNKVVANNNTGGPHKQCVCLCSKYKEMYGIILKSLNIVNLYRRMSKLKLKINVNVPQLLCTVVSVALNGEFERFGVDCCYKSVKFAIQSHRKDSTQQLRYVFVYFEL